MPLTPAMASALATAGGQATNGVLGFITNANNRKYALKQYTRERNDALTDWNNQNAYNSPAAQMQRYKDAGLNPNLIYGQTNEAPAIRSTHADTPRANAPSFDPGSVLRSYYDTQQQVQETSNLFKAGEVAEEERKLKIAQTIATYASAGLMTERMKRQIMENYVYGELTETSIEAAKVGLNQRRATLDKTLYSTEYMKNQNTRADKELGIKYSELGIKKGQLKLNQSLAENTIATGVEQRISMRQKRQLTEQEIMKIAQVIDLLRKDGTLRDYEIKLNNANTTGKDNMIFRVLGQVNKIIADNILNTPEAIKKALMKRY
jgi:hypothetical protein